MNPAKLANLFRTEFELCNVRRGETIALLTDFASRREYVAASFAAAEALGADIYEMCVNSVPSWDRVGVATVGKCKGTLEALKAADMLVCLHIPLFTKWLAEVRRAARGGRDPGPESETSVLCGFKPAESGRPDVGLPLPLRRACVKIDL